MVLINLAIKADHMIALKCLYKDNLKKAAIKEVPMIIINRVRMKGSEPGNVDRRIILEARMVDTRRETQTVSSKKSSARPNQSS